MRSDAEPPEHRGWFESGCAIDVACSGQARAEHFQQCAEFPLLRNRGVTGQTAKILHEIAAGGVATGGSGQLRQR